MRLGFSGMGPRAVRYAGTISVEWLATTVYPEECSSGLLRNWGAWSTRLYEGTSEEIVPFVRILLRAPTVAILRMGFGLWRGAAVRKMNFSCSIGKGGVIAFVCPFKDRIPMCWLSAVRIPTETSRKIRPAWRYRILLEHSCTRTQPSVMCYTHVLGRELFWINYAFPSHHRAYNKLCVGEFIACHSFCWWAFKSSFHAIMNN